MVKRTPPAPAAPKPKPAPTLHGAAPVFKPPQEDSSLANSKAVEHEAAASTANNTGNAATDTISSSPAARTAGASASASASTSVTADGPPAGPAAIAVARKFADAFVVYETGGDKAAVRKAFKATATPELTKALLQRPPRQPAGVTCRRRRSSTWSPAPSHGTIYPLSVSLLRVGVTSELRLEMEQLKNKSGASPTSSADGAGTEDQGGRRDRGGHGGAGGTGCRRPRRGGKRGGADARAASLERSARPRTNTATAESSTAPRWYRPRRRPPTPRRRAAASAPAAAKPAKKLKPAPKREARKPKPAPPRPSPIFAIPSLPASSCAISGVPPVLIPIYQRASAQYGLGPQGPAVLAGINAVETAFGTNLGPSSAGAVGWMQFMPETWATYGVDANGDGVADPNNPEDAIFAAASYLKAAGMPADTYGAIFAYNHADWYVEEVLANAGCYADEVGSQLLQRCRAGAADPGPGLPAGAGLEEANPRGIPERLRERRRPLRTRQARRLDAGGDRPPRVQLRARHDQTPAADRKRRSGSTRWSGSATRSTATTTAKSATATSPTRRRRWRG